MNSTCSCTGTCCRRSPRAGWRGWPPCGGRLAPEWCRKLLRMGCGTLALTLPWGVDSVPAVLALSGFAALMLAGVKCLPSWNRRLGGVIDGVGRGHRGGFYFAGAVGLVFAAAGGDRLRFCLPVAVLTFADAAAALVGRRWGRHRFPAGGAARRWRARPTFFVVALVVHARVPVGRSMREVRPDAAPRRPGVAAADLRGGGLRARDRQPAHPGVGRLALRAYLGCPYGGRRPPVGGGHGRHLGGPGRAAGSGHGGRNADTDRIRACVPALRSSADRTKSCRPRTVGERAGCAVWWRRTPSMPVAR